MRKKKVDREREKRKERKFSRLAGMRFSPGGWSVDGGRLVAPHLYKERAKLVLFYNPSAPGSRPRFVCGLSTSVLKVCDSLQIGSLSSF